MATSPHVHGARAIVSVNGRKIGIWTTLSYSLSYDVVPSFLLGRYSPAALTTTGVEAVNVTCGGWRLIDHSFFNEGACTELKDMLTQEDITMTVIDRATGKNIATFKGCLPTGVSSDLSSKQLASGSNSYLAMLVDTEDFENAEAASSAVLPA
jgi:hypothetical protein